MFGRSSLNGQIERGSVASGVAADVASGVASFALYAPESLCSADTGSNPTRWCAKEKLSDTVDETQNYTKG